MKIEPKTSSQSLDAPSEGERERKKPRKITILSGEKYIQLKLQNSFGIARRRQQQGRAEANNRHSLFRKGERERDANQKRC